MQKKSTCEPYPFTFKFFIIFPLTLLFVNRSLEKGGKTLHKSETTIRFTFPNYKLKKVKSKSKSKIMVLLMKKSETTNKGIQGFFHPPMLTDFSGLRHTNPFSLTQVLLRPHLQLLLHQQWEHDCFTITLTPFALETPFTQLTLPNTNTKLTSNFHFGLLSFSFFVLFEKLIIFNTIYQIIPVGLETPPLPYILPLNVELETPPLPYILPLNVERSNQLS